MRDGALYGRTDAQAGWGAAGEGATPGAQGLWASTASGPFEEKGRGRKEMGTTDKDIGRSPVTRIRAALSCASRSCVAG